MRLFDRQKNDEWRAMGAANSPLAHYTGVDFVLAGHQTVLSEPYASDLTAGRITHKDVSAALRDRNNVAQEYRISLKVRKPSVPAA
jgi:hypothetical protein